MRWLAALWVVVAAGCLGGGPAEPHTGPSGQIDGAVLNHVLIPYANTSVEIPDLGMETTTTQLGGFSFFDVPVGFHTVEVHLDDGIDREVVAVRENDISRVILQIFPTPQVKPYVADLSKTNIVAMAMPGEACEDCSWRTGLRQQHPDLVEVIVEWDGQHPALALAETHLVVELRDQDDQLLMLLDRADVQRGDTFRLCAVLPADALPDTAGSLRLDFSFDEDNMLPHPELRFESHMRLHYADDELAC